MTEADEVTLAVLAILERTTVAEQRRRAAAAYAARARQHDPAVAEIVRLVLAARAGRAGGTVTPLRRRGR